MTDIIDALGEALTFVAYCVLIYFVAYFVPVFVWTFIHAMRVIRKQDQP